MTIDRTAELSDLLARRILILDGAMGTMIQSYRLQEADYRGERFRDWPSDLKGNNDLLVLTQPAIIREIHAAYLDAGADILETNTFNSTSVSMHDYGMENLVPELNRKAARLADDAHEGAQDRQRGPSAVSAPRVHTLQGARHAQHGYGQAGQLSPEAVPDVHGQRKAAGPTEEPARDHGCALHHGGSDAVCVAACQEGDVDELSADGVSAARAIRSRSAAATMDAKRSRKSRSDGSVCSTSSPASLASLITSSLVMAWSPVQKALVHL